MPRNERLNLGIVQQGTLTHLMLESVVQQRIVDAQKTDKGMKHIQEKMEADKTTCFRKDDQGVLWFKDHIVVPKDTELRQHILDEAHLTRYSIHPGSTKMYQELKQHYWWTKMKIEIARYVAKCDTCQRVKAMHMKTASPLQWLPIQPKSGTTLVWIFLLGYPSKWHHSKLYTVEGVQHF
jgi:hypothetical protein